MNDRPLQAARVHLFMLSVWYYRNPKGRYGTRLVIGSRNWLRPGAYLWSLTVTGNDPPYYRKWRSVWRRTVPYLGMEPAGFAWQYKPRKPRKK